jgi:hypothetical protein
LALGNKGTLFRDDRERFRYVAQARHSEAASEGADTSTKPPDIVGEDDATGPHMQNFFDCVRSRQQPHAPFELGFRASIAVQMAVASYRRGTTVRWDPASDEIV